ncbi:hypothetical protein LTR16_000372 [Cryomyces antarcticus]|uniref:Alcohol dehydrogenase-like N-terminal domain-containing protein n=1 Tax=Cryomyces antarcticus TaxID=329879 RepID=A0ABR0LQZ9_9PEZI|nr:hypothetical protein LTR39_000490 [Cryomyces antarcticus]KAK5020563.1 hypothetical protein LTR60_000408 [Cryomyces antarcticus]KAK5157244.1 hypothetical protein LTR04_005434 [Oleoguttula sp. CCFEE 6159]KAK5202096.1 hypothetical protein LTR16_000372 [Cryomyces antarcticus]
MEEPDANTLLRYRSWKRVSVSSIHICFTVKFEAPARVVSEVGTQLASQPPIHNAEFFGETKVVTGANVGVGKEAVKHFARLQATRVTAAFRSVTKDKAALAGIKVETNRAGVVQIWELDYLIYVSVKAFAIGVGLGEVNDTKGEVASTSIPPGQHVAATIPSKGSALIVTHRPAPGPGPNELLIEVKCIALNPIDWKQRGSGFAVASYPTIVGSDLAGTVLSIGSSVPYDAPEAPQVV